VSGFIGKLGKLEKTKFNKNFTILTFIELIIFSRQIFSRLSYNMSWNLINLSRVSNPPKTGFN